jgi:hypothetical protein
MRLSMLWRRFTPLEKFLLGVLQRELPVEARQINQHRIDLINRVSRPTEWTEIMFYHMRSGKVVFDEEEMFSCRSSEEIVLAEITFSPAQMLQVWMSRIYSVSGCMFSIVTRPSPKPISFFREYGLKNVRLIDDPMIEFPSTVVERVRRRLPPDYDELAGKSISAWRIFDAADVYRVSLESADYVLFAEREDGSGQFLGVRAEGTSREVYRLPHDGTPERLAQTLRDAIGKSL